MHTRHAGIESTWTQEIMDGKYARVFVWNDKESMWAAFGGECDYVGRCVTFPGAILDARGLLLGRKFAEIHLVRNQIGSGYVAHEFQHLLHYWAIFQKLDPACDEHDELLAQLCGSMITVFWVAFYERYKTA